MRSSRITIIVAFVFTTCFLLYASKRNRHADDTLGIRNTESRSKLLSFQTPLSLFPPNAIISLTDDNTTSFLARPAAFGPLLPAHGLSGQLWIGSGFGDDGPRQGSFIAGAEGELGCSDVPGWNDGHSRLAPAPATTKSTTKTPTGGKKRTKRSGSEAASDRVGISSDAYTSGLSRITDDGTDDHLGDAPTSAGSKIINEAYLSGTSKHADIQSIQEGAEIAGKVVLLSRGGCGFLEKVKWVQRRGGIALIVGDDTRGGPLIQMYARGDTSNVTIPSIFTSHTTAHLLSSLIPAGSYIEDTIDDGGNIDVRVQQSKKPKQASKPTLQKQAHKSTSSSPVSSMSRKGWFSLFSSAKAANKEWIMVTEYNEDEDIVKADPKANVVAAKAKTTSRPQALPKGDDNFVIGVQDWRDPDLLDPPARSSAKTKLESHTTAHTPATKVAHSKTSSDDSSPDQEDLDARPGLLTRIFGDDDDETGASLGSEKLEDAVMMEHEGLWVTLTPTSAASPFFDTLLVLVISPLITLTVVYALLIVRSRIRRRRWRAPKSVVERLPVRTYQTIPISTVQSRVPSPTSSSPATPLLQSTSRPRPRSRTTSGIPEAGLLSRQNSDLLQPRAPSRQDQREKTNASTSGSEWKKYMGKQVECVVCLEEYIDGISRVMSLPCGHEFHVECM